MHHVVILDPGVSSREPKGTYPPYDDGFKKGLFIKNASGLPLEGQVCFFFIKLLKGNFIGLLYCL